MYARASVGTHAGKRAHVHVLEQRIKKCGGRREMRGGIRERGVAKWRVGMVEEEEEE